MTLNNGKGFQSELKSRIRGEIYLDGTRKGVYATDASIYQIQPKAVVIPRDEDDVRMAVEVAAEFGIPIIPRGAGTSLGGQVVGDAIILDFSKHMNNILEINAEEHWVRVQPGVVRDVLNAEIAKYGLQFAPDPATTSRANIGGMIGNNSSGMRSIVHGKTIDHVIEARVLLADGEELTLNELSPREYAEKASQKTREGEILRKFRHIIEDNKEEIIEKYPKILRRTTGYNLDEFTNGDNWNLAKLMTGSEGTLSVLLEAKINLVPVPKAAAICVVHFTDRLAAIRGVKAIVEYGPSAVEILDELLISLAKASPTTAKICDFIEDGAGTVLLTEMSGQSEAEVHERLEKMIAGLKSRNIGFSYPVRTRQEEMDHVWAVRKNSLGLLEGMKSERKPIAFIEDAAVPLDVFPEYIEQVVNFCKCLGVEVVMYAHASVGLLHVRPILDLKKKEDIELMKRIAGETLKLVKKYKGSWSGEHGDGLVRSPFIRDYYGPQIYDAFKQVKALFDPDNLLNPGKIIDAPEMDNNLRYGPDYRTSEFQPTYSFEESGGFLNAVEMCSGVGVCRQTMAGTMCPSFRATRDEEHSTRGRANALRLAISGKLGDNGMTSEPVFEVLDLCLSCKACKTECPSNVDMAKLKSEFLQNYRKKHGTSIRDRMIAGSMGAANLSSGWIAPLMNFVQRSLIFRKTLEMISGFDSRRILPDYARVTFGKWFKKHQNNSPLKSARKVVLFDDTYMNNNEPEVGISAVELLESCGYEVVLARAGCCQRPRISHGFLKEAKRDGLKTMRNLDEFIREGLKIVVCEPGCASALTDDLPDLIEDKALGKRIRENTMMIDHFLANEIEEGRLDCEFTTVADEILIHGHCHQKTIFGTMGMKKVFDRVPGLKYSEVDSGCCGMAGSFGYEKEHYDLSMKIGEDRLFPAVRELDDNAAMVACGTSCRHQISDGTGKKALHWVQTIRAKK